MRLAVWMTSSGRLLDVAIVERHGPFLLRVMLDEQLMLAKEQERPCEVVVWPSVAAAFRTMRFPAVIVEKAMFLKTVVEDQCDFGHLPHGVPARAG